jgi:hypothetical protein
MAFKILVIIYENIFFFFYMISRPHREQDILRKNPRTVPRLLPHCSELFQNLFWLKFLGNVCISTFIKRKLV